MSRLEEAEAEAIEEAVAHVPVENRGTARSIVRNLLKHAKPGNWPAPGFEDTKLGVLMEPEVDHGEAEVYARVQA